MNHLGSNLVLPVVGRGVNLMIKSVGHIGFRDEYEFYWIQDSAGKKVVVKVPISNPMNSDNQRIGARFEGTEAWFEHFGKTIFPSNQLETGKTA